MGKRSTPVTAGLARIEFLQVLRIADPHLGVECRAYVRLSFRPDGKKHDLSILFYLHDQDRVRFMLELLEKRTVLRMQIKGLESRVPFFDALAQRLGFRSHWIASTDIVHMTVGDRQRL